MFLLRYALLDLTQRFRSLFVFIACLVLGVLLIAATGSLYQRVSDSLLSDTRALLGGDLEVDGNIPLPEEVVTWLRSRADVSLLKEVDTLLEGQAGTFVRAELLVNENNYPLYGSLVLQPPQTLAEATAKQDGYWGAAIDPLLAERLGLAVGDRLTVGLIELSIRALVLQQPDRRLNAAWSGPPLLLSDEALAASGLVRIGSRVDHEYRVRLPEGGPSVAAFTAAFREAFPDGNWEVRTFEARSEQIAQRLAQVATALILTGLATLFIGGLGVTSSISAYLDDKLPAMATLQALGLRKDRLAAIYLLQILLLALLAGLIGGGLGLALSSLAVAAVANDLPLGHVTQGWGAGLLLACLFSLLTALLCSTPVLGRALAAKPSGLFRGQVSAARALTPGWRMGTIAIALLYAGLLFAFTPDRLVLAGFAAMALGVWLLFEGISRAVRRLAEKLDSRAESQTLSKSLALANLMRADSPLRIMLLSLGTALTLMVACTLLVLAVMRTLSSTVPENVPQLVFYDLFPDQVRQAEALIAAADPMARTDILPLVLGRLTAINDTLPREWPGLSPEDLEDTLGDTFKLSYLAENPDQLELVAGQWWQPGENTLPRMALEDREARQLGVGVGDRLRFSAGAGTLTLEIAALFQQKGLQTRFWFEGIVEQGALDRDIGRYVGAVYTSDRQALQMQRSLAEAIPSLVTARTADLVQAAGELLGKASVGVALIAGLSLASSLLVLTSLVMLSRRRQRYEAAVLVCLGARQTQVRRAWIFESLCLSGVTTGIASLLGLLLALPLANVLLQLPATEQWWLGLATAMAVSGMTLLGGLLPALCSNGARPADLLRGQ